MSNMLSRDELVFALKWAGIGTYDWNVREEIMRWNTQMYALLIEALQHISYDIILMDCQMPEMDGYKATQALRQREQNLENPCPWHVPVYIIAMTANAMQGEREKCLAVGMDDYLSKPVRTSDLQTALERWKLAQNLPNRATIPGEG